MPLTRGVFQGVFHDKGALDDRTRSIYPSHVAGGLRGEKAMTKPSPKVQGVTGSSRIRSKKTAKTPPSEGPVSAASAGIRDDADDVFDHLSVALSSLGRLSGEVQKQYQKWSSDPPLDSNRQNRFTNKIDAWVTKGLGIIDELRAANDAGQKLPEHTKCTPKEKFAKRMLAGLLAMRTTQLLQTLVTKLQSLENRARQPIPPEEAKKLWDDFGEFVLLLSRAGEELREIKRLIAAARTRFATGKAATASGKTTGVSSRITSKPMDRPALRHGEEASSGLDKLEKEIDNLCRTLGNLVADHEKLSPEAAEARKTLTSQHEDVLLTWSNFERQMDGLQDRLQHDEDCRELLTGHPNAELLKIGNAVQDVITSLRHRVQACRVWLKAICCRESTVFRLPSDIPNQFKDIINKAGKIDRRLRRMASRFGDTAPVTRSAAHRRRVDLSKCNADEIRILAQLLENLPAGTSGHTVPSMAAATGFDDQKVRRILNVLLKKDGIPVIGRDEQGSLRGKGKTSPHHLFFIVPEHVAHVRDFVRGS